MIFNLEIDDAALAYIYKSCNGRSTRSFVLNRWSEVDSGYCGHLIENGIICDISYGGEGCYNPTYRLTDLGVKIYDQYIQLDNSRNSNS